MFYTIASKYPSYKGSFKAGSDDLPEHHQLMIPYYQKQKKPAELEKISSAGLGLFSGNGFGSSPKELLRRHSPMDLDSLPRHLRISGCAYSLFLLPRFISAAYMLPFEECRPIFRPQSCRNRRESRGLPCGHVFSDFCPESTGSRRRS